MPSLRLLLVGMASLVAGFGLGYAFRLHSPATIAPIATPVAVATSSKTQAQVERTAPLPSVEATPTDAAPDSAALMRQRLDALRWLKRVGAPLRINLLAGDRLNPSLAKILEIDAADVARINAALRDTKESIDNARVQRATSHPSADGKILTIDVSGLDPAASGALYDRVMATFKTALDADRMPLLEELTADSLERLYDRYGLNAIRYEFTLQPRQVAGLDPHYDFKRSFTDADGIGSGWSGSTLAAAHISRYDPLLARLLPAGIVTSAR